MVGQQGRVVLVEVLSGVKISNAKFIRVTHNGTVIHENVELSGPTRAAMFGDESTRGPLMLQGDHGPVAYRNIRLRSLDGSKLLLASDKNSQ